VNRDGTPYVSPGPTTPGTYSNVNQNIGQTPTYYPEPGTTAQGRQSLGDIQQGVLSTPTMDIVTDVLQDPIKCLSLAAMGFGFVIGMHPEVLKEAIKAAGKVTEGFTPGRITDVGNVL
jgi:hypothetical protein